MEYSKIYTKKGDQGFTSTVNGDKVQKNDPLIECIGTIDEFHATLGMCHNFLISGKTTEKIRNSLLQCQKTLIKIMSEISASADQMLYKETICDEDLEALTQFRNFITTLLEEENEEIKDWIVLGDGDTPASRMFYLANTSCRKCERQVVGVKISNKFLNQRILKFFNEFGKVLYFLSLYHNIGLKKNKA